jgi:hypothetical protein
VNELVKTALETGGNAADARVRYLNGETVRQLLKMRLISQRLEGEVSFLRAERSRLNEVLAQRLLTEATPQKSIWGRCRGC